MHQLFWMLFTGFPLVGLVHIAIGSFLSLQAYYGSTFVDGTGAVVGVGLLRNLGAMMTGLTFAGILAARMVPELRILSRYLLVARGLLATAVIRSDAVVPSGSTSTANASDDRSLLAVWPLPGSPRRRSPACCFRSGGSRSAPSSAGKRRSR